MGGGGGPKIDRSDRRHSELGQAKGGGGRSEAGGHTEGVGTIMGEFDLNCARATESGHTVEFESQIGQRCLWSGRAGTCCLSCCRDGMPAAGKSQKRELGMIVEEAAKCLRVQRAMCSLSILARKPTASC